MSVRAYRVNSIDRADDASLNLWHDRDVIDMIEKYAEDYCIEPGPDGGLCEVPVEAIQKTIENFEWDEDNEYIKEALEKDVQWARENDETYILYLCF